MPCCVAGLGWAGLDRGFWLSWAGQGQLGWAAGCPGSAGDLGTDIVSSQAEGRGVKAGVGALQQCGFLPI